MSKLKDTIKEAIRKNVREIFPKYINPNMMGTVISDNGDGTFEVQSNDGNHLHCEAIYPVAIGQFVMIIRNAKGYDKIIPYVPKAETVKIIHPPLFAGKELATLFSGIAGTALPSATFDASLDVLLQSAGNNNILALRARDILTNADYLNAQAALAVASPSTVVYGISKDRSEIVLVYAAIRASGPVSDYPPTVVVFLSLKDAFTGTGPVLDAPLGIYGPNKITIHGYNYIDNFPPTQTTPVTNAFIYGLHWSASKLAYFTFYSEVSGGSMQTIATFAASADVPNQPLVGVSNLSTVGIDPNLVGVVSWGPTLALADLSFFFTYNQFFPTPFQNTQLSTIANGNYPSGQVPIQVVDSVTYNHQPGIPPGDYYFPPVYLPLNVTAAWNNSGGNMSSQAFGIWATRRENNEAAWCGIWKIDNRTFPTQTLYTALLSQVPGKSAYLISQIDSSIQITQPASGTGAPITSKANLNPGEMAVRAGIAYTVDYSDNNGSATPFFCLPKVYPLTGKLGNPLTLVPGTEPALKGISPGFVDPDAIRLFSTSIDGTGLFSYLNLSFRMMDMSKI